MSCRIDSLAQRGFTYLGVLLILVLFGLALASAGVVWHTVSVRQKEQELLFVGEQYRDAIASYYASGQGELPKSLDDLIRDPRFPTVKRHLRRIYPDPMTGSTQWGLVKAGDRILGVYSLALGKPLKEIPIAAQGEDKEIAAAYSDWKFVFNPGTAGLGPDVDPRSNLPVVATPGAGQAPASLNAGSLPDDSCELAHAQAIVACQGGKLGANTDSQSCVAEAMRKYQACAQAGR